MVDDMLGECWLCNESDLVALDFHHINPDNKSFNISGNGLCKSKAKRYAELSKCALLCANCHRKVHLQMKLNKPLKHKK